MPSPVGLRRPPTLVDRRALGARNLAWWPMAINPLILVPLLQHAYGLTVTGLPWVAELDPGPSRSGVAVQVTVAEGLPEPAARPLDAAGGVRRLADGRLLELDRERGTAVFHGPPLTPDLLAHPYLSPVATAFGRWAGREAFHAGAFLAADRAWAVLGPRTAGKSTLMAALAARDVPVLSDDIVVTDGAVVLSGPRCVDLREVPPVPGLDLRTARLGTRHRLHLPERPEQVPFGGWVFLDWDDDLGVDRVPAARLLGHLAARRAWRHLDSRAELLLDLAAAPAWTLRRPRRWDQLEASLDLLLATVSATAVVGATGSAVR
jgi:hypothetical protein